MVHHSSSMFLLVLQDNLDSGHPIDHFITVWDTETDRLTSFGASLINLDRSKVCGSAADPVWSVWSAVSAGRFHGTKPYTGNPCWFYSRKQQKIVLALVTGRTWIFCEGSKGRGGGGVGGETALRFPMMQLQTTVNFLIKIIIFEHGDISPNQ